RRGFGDRQREPRFFKKARLPSEPPSLKNKSIGLEIGVSFTNSVALGIGDRQREPRFFKKARLPSEPPSLKNRSIGLEIRVNFANSAALTLSPPNKKDELSSVLFL
ncbi:MAG: hypothetical protein LWY06_08495, partial [Firmicutes bacterium]|nr:hypothetical protein [Bacillota bacterium]